MFPRSDDRKMLYDEELNEILFHTVPKTWLKKEIVLGFILRENFWHSECLKAWRLNIPFTKVPEQPLKINKLGKKPTAPVEDFLREDKPRHLKDPQREALEFKKQSFLVD